MPPNRKPPPSNPATRRVGIVEDHAQVRQALATALQVAGQWQLIFELGSIREVRAWPGLIAPDVVLIDLGLPDGSGLDLIAELRQRWPSCECLVISMFGDERQVIRAIECGAGGYILKGQGEDDLNEHLQHLLDGGAPMSPAIARHLLRRVARDAQPALGVAQTGPALEALTPREADVLHQLSLGEPYDAVASRLEMSVNTVRYHVKSLYTKLGVKNRQTAVLEARRRGLFTDTT